MANSRDLPLRSYAVLFTVEQISEQPCAGRHLAGIGERHGQDRAEPHFAGTLVRAARPNLDRGWVEFSGCVAVTETAQDRLRYDGAEELDWTMNRGILLQRSKYSRFSETRARDRRPTISS